MKKFSLILLKVSVFLISIILIYFLAVIILPLIGVNKKNNNKETKGTIDIYILTNGMHTDIVMPVETEVIDWYKIIPYTDTKSKKIYKNVAFGWGDRGFYLDTPEWSDLKFSTAFNAAFGMGTSAMHVTFYNEIYQNENCKRIKTSKEDYIKLVTYIKNSFKFNTKGEIEFIKTNALYGDNDSFYEAKGKYNLFYTCNTWASNALKSANQKSPLWTATQQGIFYHYR